MPSCKVHALHGVFCGLGDNERVEDSEGLLVRALEPTLVADLDLQARSSDQIVSEAVSKVASPSKT